MVIQQSAEPAELRALTLMREALELLDRSDNDAVGAMLDQAVHALQFNLETASGK